MKRGFVFIARKKWFFIAAITIFVLYLLVFVPGFMSGDSINQFIQAKTGRYSDWHPPAMAILWHYLMAITGKVSSLLIFQLSLLVGSTLAISLSLLRITASVRRSFLAFLLLLLPSTFTIAGVLWKDVLLAFTLLASFSAALSLSQVRSKKIKLFLSVLLLLLIFFGINVRHNAFPAWIPLLFYIFYHPNILGAYLRNSRSRFAAVVLTLFAGLIVSPAVINKAYSVNKDNVVAAVMVDDITELATADEIRDAQIKDRTENYLLELQYTCNQKGVQTDALFLCDTIDGFVELTHTDFPAVQSFWIKTIVNDPIDYLKFRFAQFYKFITPEYVYAWQEGTDPNRHGAPAASGIFREQGRKFALYSIRDFGFFFRPYFWLIIGVFCLFYCIKNRRDEVYIFPLALSASGIIYILSYIPSVIVYDYRMVYWSAISIAASLLFIVAVGYRRKKNGVSLKGKSKSKDFEYTGVQVLEAMEEAKNYNKYLVKLVLKNYAAAMSRGGVVDYGAGIGTYAKMIFAESRLKPICLEPDKNLRKLTTASGFKSIASLKELKTKPRLVYSLNVFEHIEKDREVAKQIYKEMGDGGRLLIYVPAFQVLYSSMDKKVEHFRRYRKGQLKAVVEDAGFSVQSIYYADPLGFFAALIYKLFDSGQGYVSPKGVKIFDKIAFPLSLILQPITKYFFGKNLVVEAVKDPRK